MVTVYKYEVWVDWDGNGRFVTADENITDDVMRLEFKLGRSGDTLTPLGMDSECLVTVNNESGDYNTFENLEKIIPGRRVIVDVLRHKPTDPNPNRSGRPYGGERPSRTMVGSVGSDPDPAADNDPDHPNRVRMWTGYLDNVSPQVAINQQHTALLNITGPLNWLSRNRFDNFFTLSDNLSTGAAINEILDRVPWPDNEEYRGEGLWPRDTPAGKSNVRSAAILNSGALGRPQSHVNVINALNLIVRCELGYLRDGHDGSIIFEDRDRRPTSLDEEPRAFFSDDIEEVDDDNVLGIETLAQAGSYFDSVYNQFQSDLHRYETRQPTDVKFWIDIEGASSWVPGSNERPPTPALRMDPGFPYTVTHAQTPPPYIWPWVTPVRNTDYRFNTQADGMGEDISDTLRVVVVDSSYQEVTVQVTPITKSGYLTLLKIRGSAISENAHLSTVILRRDVDSIAKYDLRKFEWPNQMVTNEEEAEDHLNWLLSIYKEPLPQLTMSYVANRSEKNLDAALNIKVSDKVLLRSLRMGIHDDFTLSARVFFVESVQHTIEPARIHRIQYSLSDASRIFPTFRLHTGSVVALAGQFRAPGRLGISTRVYF